MSGIDLLVQALGNISSAGGGIEAAAARDVVTRDACCGGAYTYIGCSRPWEATCVAPDTVCCCSQGSVSCQAGYCGICGVNCMPPCC